MVATASDLARFAIALRDGRLFRPSDMQIMMKWQPAGSQQEIGAGLFRTHLPDGAYTVGQTGDVLGFLANMYWLESIDVVIVGLSNVGLVNAGAIPFTAPQGESIRSLAIRYSADRKVAGCRAVH
jgi:D-alanyl-D-alanine carboxypeptidase